MKSNRYQVLCSLAVSSMILSLFTACSSSSTQNCQPNAQGYLPPGCSPTGGSYSGGSSSGSSYRSGGSSSSGSRVSSPASGRSGFGSFGGGRSGG
ncbi:MULTISPECIES: hypothetical protein [Leptolyngbya]|uniref:hypothetical protein n=1 Tax=Leptolyngbya TaxID=47251 RepID=UPI0011818877|nr:MULTISPECIES: hypothetical protein [Leptolyngbya]MBD1858117.1 hypothetical protein [Leptolyngbya sp. FACHB-1624]MBD2371333.1 hypothetical protein [Leptolyngbya sp. FACHB-161]MBD2377812.1 hypothetical protein [Leptolyngbya sp. FACHB-238]MBD2402249.1 hypothetical protein [Leptolyngbya sp. FACHB-239]MBD2408742.1 hypothetical protein [Leptolyngbya sp. FACHB-402]